MFNYERIYSLLKDENKFYTKTGHVPRSYVSHYLKPLLKEILELNKQGFTLYAIYLVFIKDNLIPSEIKFSSFRNYVAKAIKKDQVVLLTSSKTDDSITECLEESTDNLNLTSDRVIPILKENSTFDDCKSLKAFNETIEKLEHENVEIALFKDQISKRIRKSQNEEVWWNYQGSLDFSLQEATIDQADQNEQKVDFLEEALVRDFTYVPTGTLRTLNPLSSKYPFRCLVNWLLYDDNGIIFEASHQLPISRFFTLGVCCYDSVEFFMESNPERCSGVVTVDDLQADLIEYFKRTHGEFCPVWRVLD